MGPGDRFIEAAIKRIEEDLTDRDAGERSCSRCGKSFVKNEELLKLVSADQVDRWCSVRCYSADQRLSRLSTRSIRSARNFRYSIRNRSSRLDPVLDGGQSSVPLPSLWSKLQKFFTRPSFDLNPFFDQIKSPDEGQRPPPPQTPSAVRPVGLPPAPMVAPSVDSPVTLVTHRSDEGSLPMVANGQPVGHKRRSPTPSRFHPFRTEWRRYEMDENWSKDRAFRPVRSLSSGEIITNGMLGLSTSSSMKWFWAFLAVLIGFVILLVMKAK